MRALPGETSLQVEHGNPHVNKLHVTDGAERQRAMLEEVLAEGNAGQRDEARKLLSELS